MGKEEKVILVIRGGGKQIFPVKSIGKVKVRFINLCLSGQIRYLGEDGIFLGVYKGQENPVVIFIDSPNFEPERLAENIAELTEKLNSWHPDTPILQIKYPR